MELRGELSGRPWNCYDSARRYALERIQFDKPIASFQLVQKKLAEMLTEITKAQLLNWKLGKMMDEGKATTAQISLAKRNNVALALDIAREARQIHGGTGYHRRVSDDEAHDESGICCDL